MALEPTNVQYCLFDWRVTRPCYRPKFDSIKLDESRKAFYDHRKCKIS